MKRLTVLVVCLLISTAIAGCQNIGNHTDGKSTETSEAKQKTEQEASGNQMEKGEVFTVNTKVKDVINDTAFGDYRRLIFPVDMQIKDNLKLKNVEDILPWYSEVNPKKTVEIINYMKEQVENGQQKTDLRFLLPVYKFNSNILYSVHPVSS